MTEIHPGDLLVVKCPTGSEALAKIGETLSFGKDPKLSDFVVIAKQANELTLGPLRAGNFSGSIPCTHNQSISIESSLKALAPNEMPERANPLGMLGLEYPTWLWIALGLAALLILIAMIYGVVWVRRKFFAPVLENEENLQPSESEKLRNFIFQAKKSKLALQSEESRIIELYSGANDGLRKFLEERFQFKASWATTSEFVANFKASAGSFAGSRKTFKPVESLLHQADMVRFSKSHPPDESRTRFLNDLEALYKNVVQITRAHT